MKQNQQSAALRGLLGAALLAAASLAQAQYMWVDEKGLKQLSDQPPPVSVPQNRILKQPRQQGTAQQQQQPPAEGDAGGADAATAPAAKARPQLTLAERNADYNKRRADSQAAEQKSAQEAEKSTIQAKNCELTRASQRTLDDGVRISSYDKSGQRIILDDAQRAERSKRNQQILADCPK